MATDVRIFLSSSTRAIFDIIEVLHTAHLLIFSGTIAAFAFTINPHLRISRAFRPNVA
jgi:hypothetical protein